MSSVHTIPLDTLSGIVSKCEALAKNPLSHLPDVNQLHMKYFSLNIDCLTLIVKLWQCDANVGMNRNSSTEFLYTGALAKKSPLSEEIKLHETMLCNFLGVKMPSISECYQEDFNDFLVGLFVYTNKIRRILDEELDPRDALDNLLQIRYEFCDNLWHHMTNGKPYLVSELGEMFVQLGSAWHVNPTKNYYGLLYKMSDIRERMVAKLIQQ